MPAPLAATEAAQNTDYRILALVGQGQFAQVYGAIHRRSGQLVAIKRTRHAPESASQEPFVLAALNHPNLVGCQSIAQTKTGYQFVLEYCEGGTLRSALDAALDSALPFHLDTATTLATTFATTKSLITNILLGLGYLHDQGIIHGDLKPENILLTYPARSVLPLGSGLTESGLTESDLNKSDLNKSRLNTIQVTAKIADFGNAHFIQRPNRSRRDIGSPTYAAPERFDGESSYAADLYSVGVMLYEMLLGDRPFSGSPAALRQAHQTQPIPLPDSLTPAARQFFATALHKQPSQRFSSAAAMLLALQNLSRLYPAKRISAKATVSRTHPGTIPSVVITQAPTPIICSAKISEPIERLIALPQGYGILTAKSFYLLTSANQLVPVAHFKDDTWMAVDPKGRWLVAIAKALPAHTPNQTQFYSLAIATAAIGQPPFLPIEPIPNRAGSASRLSTGFTTDLTTDFMTDLTASHTETIQILAIDSRYLLRVRTAQQSHQTFLEGFTRKGHFIGRLSFNIPIAEISRTAVPYQLIARTATADSSLVLITLKPFQIRHFPQYCGLQQIAAVSWGYLLTTPRHTSVLDPSANLVSVIEGLPPVGAIASPLFKTSTAADKQQLLIATSAAFTPAASTKPSPLSIIHLDNLDLGIIF